jgi:hypothetical protein
MVFHRRLKSTHSWPNGVRFQFTGFKKCKRWKSAKRDLPGLVSDQDRRNDRQYAPFVVSPDGDTYSEASTSAESTDSDLV